MGARVADHGRAAYSVPPSYDRQRPDPVSTINLLRIWRRERLPTGIPYPSTLVLNVASSLNCWSGPVHAVPVCSIQFVG